jgi:hypothetical protein
MDVLCGPSPRRVADPQNFDLMMFDAIADQVMVMH